MAFAHNWQVFNFRLFAKPSKFNQKKNAGRAISVTANHQDMLLDLIENEVALQSVGDLLVGGFFTRCFGDKAFDRLKGFQHRMADGGLFFHLKASFKIATAGTCPVCLEFSCFPLSVKHRLPAFKRFDF